MKISLSSILYTARYLRLFVRLFICLLFFYFFFLFRLVSFLPLPIRCIFSIPSRSNSYDSKKQQTKKKKKTNVQCTECTDTSHDHTESQIIFYHFRCLEAQFVHMFQFMHTEGLDANFEMCMCGTCYCFAKRNYVCDGRMSNCRWTNGWYLGW